jgi:transcriptional regulator with XRE-family HTH domain
MHQFDDGARRRELGDFLRSRRERLSPAAAGLRSSRRRRTPGLRREEVAELAGIGTAWYTWLEQARDIRPSEGALRQIARALQLDDAEKRYLYDLALEHAPIKRGEEIVPPALLTILNGFDGPAYVRGQRWDLLAYNEIAEAIFDMRRIPDRNLLRNTFRGEHRRLLPNWAHVAHQQVAMFRAENAGSLKDPWIHQFVDELCHDDADFARWWSEQAVTDQYSGHKTYDDPRIGRLSFDFTTLRGGDGTRLRLVVYVADDDETRAKVAAFVRAWRQGRVSGELWALLRAAAQPGSAHP